MNDVLYGRWVAVEKDSLPREQVQHMRQTLTLRQELRGAARTQEPPIVSLYQETDKTILVPRGYYEESLRVSHAPIYSIPEVPGNPWEAGGPALAKELFPEQEAALREALIRYKRGVCYGGILQAAPGWGKSILVLALAERLRARAIICVNREFLFNQWYRRIQEFLPGARIGRVMGNLAEYEGTHITVAMVQTLTSRALPQRFYDYFDLFVADEAHTLGAPTWVHTPTLFGAPWRLGVTATPRRKDGLMRAVFWHLGRIFYVGESARMRLSVRTVKTDFKLLPGAGDASRDVLLDFLCQNEQRNDLVVDQLVLATRAQRKILVLSERVEHLRVLCAKFRTRVGADGPSTGFFVGGLDENMWAIGEKCQVIFATAQLAATALDVPALDTLFLTTPLSDVTQAAGRILRPHRGKKSPVFVEFVDSYVAACVNAAVARASHLAKLA